MKYLGLYAAAQRRKVYGFSSAPLHLFFALLSFFLFLLVFFFFFSSIICLTYYCITQMKDVQQKSFF